VTRDLKPAARFLLWDYERGGLAYVLMWLAILAFVLLVPAAWLGDPMVLP
jgi:hypothetical protein